MTLAALIRKRASGKVANANPAKVANDEQARGESLARLAALSLANPPEAKAEGVDLTALLTEACKGVEGIDPAVFRALLGPEDAHQTDPVVISLLTQNGPCKVTVPRDQYDPEAFTAFANQWALIPLTTETDPRRWRSAEITAPDGAAVTVAAPGGWGQAHWQRLARAYFPQGHVVHALDPAEPEGRRNTETEDLRERFLERVGILEYDGGLPRAQAELEAARITVTYARNCSYQWASLRAALSAYPELLASLPDKAGPVDSLPLGVSKVAVLGARRVVRQGVFMGEHDLKATPGRTHD